MKQISIPALIATTLLTLTACGADGSDATQPAPAATEATVAQPAAPTSTDDTASDDTASDDTANDTAGDDAVVEIDSSRFGQPELRVAAGTTVTFVNNDPYAHTVTSSGDSPIEFDSGEFGEGETFEVTFDESGEYPYFCQIHPTMRAVVIVE